MDARKRSSPSPHESSSSMDDSMPSSAGSSTSTNATSTTLELEERFQRAMIADAPEEVHDVDIEEIDQEELDALCAREMFALTGKEREDVLHDIHGVADAVEETPSFCQKQVQLLQQELNILVSRPRKNTGAYLKALHQNEEYVESLYLMFLRADQWKPKEAAERLVGFLEKKVDLFGVHSLTEKITIERHMTTNDRQALESGFFQLLSVRDAAGRAILMGIPPLRNYKHVDNLKRAFFYVVMAALEDVETQKMGIVMIGFNMGSKRVVDRQAAFAVNSLKRYVPFRVGSIHYCYDDMRFRVMMTMAMLLMGAMQRVRFRAHFGNYTEVSYVLSTYGIPTSVLPILPDGEPKVKNHKSWLKQRYEQESKQAKGLLPQQIIVIPNRSDVLLGRGKPIQENFGNLRYLSLLDHYQDVYDRSLKFEKMRISQRLLDSVKEYGGRFLKQECAGWVETDSATARDKVGHAFRTRRAAISVSASLTNKEQANVSTFTLNAKRSSGYLTMDTIPEQGTSTAIAMLETTPEQVTSKPAQEAIGFNDAEIISSKETITGKNGKRARQWDEISPD